MIQRTEARRLASTRELSLISSSLSPALQTLSAARLKSKISRARRLREKYQDLYRRQKLGSKSRMTGTPYERLNARTLRKKQMFTEALTRLRHQLVKVSSPAKKTARVSARKVRTTAASAHVRRRRPSRITQDLKARKASPESHKTLKLKAAGYQGRHARRAASVRRRQARRDARGRQ
jgi:hypothetical protein